MVLKGGKLHTLTKPKALQLNWDPAATSSAANPPVTPPVSNSNNVSATTDPATPQIDPASTEFVQQSASAAKTTSTTPKPNQKQQKQQQQVTGVPKTPDILVDDSDDAEFDLFNTMDEVTARLHVKKANMRLKALEKQKVAGAQQNATEKQAGIVRDGGDRLANAQWVSRAMSNSSTLGVHVGGATTTSCVQCGKKKKQI